MNKKNDEITNMGASLFKTIWLNRKFISIFTASATIISIVASLLITPLYLSTAIVFPAATSSVSFSEQRNAKASAVDFGEEEQAEQLIQILQSSQIRNIIVSEFDLFKQYDISKNDKNKNHKLIKAYNEHFSFTRTRYGSIKIDVLDKDPKLAAMMANKIVDLIDTVKNEMISKRTIPAFEINKRTKKRLEKERDSLLNALAKLSEKGVISLDARQGLFQAYVDSENDADRNEMKQKIDANLKYGSEYDGLEFMRNEKIAKLEKFQVAFDQAESDANSKFNHKFIVEKAVIADKKEKPKRMIIVLISFLGSFLFSILLVLFKIRFKELKSIKE